MKEKVIGILGGMGPEATLALFDMIIKNTPASRDQDHFRIIIDNNPKIPDRTAAIINKGETPLPEMIKGGISLERAGADFIILPCISAHFFLHELRGSLNLPIISAFDETSEMIKEGYPNTSKVGLLATTGTIEGGRFQERLQMNGIETLVPSPEDQETVMSVIYSIKSDPSGKDRHDNKIKLIKIVDHLSERGAQAIIAGCTEIPLNLSEKDIKIPFIDPLLILARAAIREARLT